MRSDGGQFLLGLRRCAVVGIVAALMVAFFSGAGDDEAPDQRDRLQNLSIAEQEELLRKREAFERLNEDEQQRMRQLHVAIISSPDSDRLQQVMLQYHEWLKTLTAKERADLLSLPPADRISQITKLMEEQRQRRFRDLVRTSLAAEDVKAIFAWLDNYAQNHQEELLAMLPEQMRARISQSRMSPSVQRRMLMMAVGSRSELQLPPPTDEEFETLSESLSENAQKALAELPRREQQLQLVREWLRAGIASRMAPQVSRERLLSFYRDYRERTTDKKRVEQLDSLPPEEFYDEVKKLYFRTHGHWRGRRDGEHRNGPHGWDGRGDRDRRPGDSPDGDRPRPPGGPRGFQGGPPPGPSDSPRPRQ